MKDTLKNLKPGMEIETKNGWWVKVLEITADSIAGFFAVDRISLSLPQKACYRGLWDEDGNEILTDRENPHPGLFLEPKS